MERIAPFTLHRPASLAEAAALLAATPGARPLAGGTDLLPNLRDGIAEPPALVDLAGIAELATIAVTREGVTIGAGVTLARIASDANYGASFPSSRKPRSPSRVRAIARSQHSAAISVSIRAASSTTRANGGAVRTISA